MQLDEAARGFSLRFDARARHAHGGERARRRPTSSPKPSADELADIFFHYGEERASRRIARAIVADRVAAPFVSTLQLARPRRARRAGPARRAHASGDARVSGAAHRRQRRTRRAGARPGAAERALTPGGRLAVVTFHSLEDRIVKQFLARRTGRGRAVSRLLPGEPRRAAPELSRLSRPAGRPDGGARSPPTRARAPPNCVSPSASTRRPLTSGPAARSPWGCVDVAPASPRSPSPR